MRECMLTPSKIRDKSVSYFAEAHGMSIEETEQLFDGAGLSGFIIRCYMAFGRLSRTENVDSCRLYIIHHGGNCPPMKV